MSDDLNGTGLNNHEKAFRRTAAEEHASVLAGLSSNTMVITREGETPVEWLETGDEVLTRDRGFEPVVWVNRVKLDRQELLKLPEFAPISIKAGLVDRQAPMEEVTVSPSQLMLVRSPQAEAYFGSHEVLVPATAIGTQVDPRDMHWNTRVSYAQVMVSSHQMIMANGAWVGSLYTGNLALDLNDASCPLVGKLEQPRMIAARPILDVEEGRLLMAAVWREQAARDYEEEQTRRLEVG